MSFSESDGATLMPVFSTGLGLSLPLPSTNYVALGEALEV